MQKQSSLKRYLKSIGGLAILTILATIIGYLSYIILFGINTIYSNDYMNYILQIVFDFLTLLISSIIFLHIGGKRHGFREFLGGLKKYVLKRSISISLLVTFIFLAAVFALRSVYFDGFIWNKLSRWEIIYLLLIGLLECLLEPMGEELLYRYTADWWLSKYFKSKTVILLSTLYYVVIHTFYDNINLMVLINLALFSILLNYIFLKFKNIWYCIIPRFIFEFITSFGFSINLMGKDKAGIIFLSRKNNSIINGGLFGGYGSIVFTCITIIFIYLFVHRPSKD